MPSLQQLRNEDLANAVERARRPPFVLTLFGVADVPLDVRIECQDGTSIECRLLELIVDGNEVVGRQPSGASVVLPLERVQTLWHYRRRTARSLSLWAGTMLSSAAVGAALVSATAWTGVAEGALVGALIGALAGIGVVVLLDKWKALYEWQRLFDRAAA